uniref:Odorant receptor n=1 Tax=Timema tahoe TaxID=61484 RepID=A0A7R9NVI8_9NEOP|nr:unnamed protein product [Timema tahoe]
MSGLWPNTQRSRAYDLYILSVVSLFTSSVVMQITELVYSHDDLRYVAEILFLLVACVINLFKISHILHRHTPISRLLSDLEREPPAELRQYCQEAIDKTDKRCKNFAILLLAICMGTGLSWSVSPLIVDRGKEDGSLVLVFAARFPFDLSKNNFYAIALIYEVIVVTGFSFVHAAVSLIQLVIIIHMCGRFEMLNTLLTSTDERAVDEFNRKANVSTRERELFSSPESLEEHLSSNSIIKFTNNDGLSRPQKLSLILESCSKNLEMNQEIETTSGGSIKSWVETSNSEQCCLNHTRYHCLVQCVQMHTRLVRSTYHGHWDGHVINEPGSLPPSDGPKLPQGEFTLPEVAYQDALPIPYEKFKDLQQLKKFCGEEARTFYSQLPKMAPGEKSKKKDRKNRIEIVFPNVVKIQKAVQRKSL